MLVPGAESPDAKLSGEERARASKWVSHQAQSIVRKATLILMVRETGGGSEERGRERQREAGRRERHLWWRHETSHRLGGMCA